jgi:hypothetical protein
MLGARNVARALLLLRLCSGSMSGYAVTACRRPPLVEPSPFRPSASTMKARLGVVQACSSVCRRSAHTAAGVHHATCVHGWRSCRNAYTLARWLHCCV